MRERGVGEPVIEFILFESRQIAKGFYSSIQGYLLAVSSTKCNTC
jgi:hypothetical protein